MSDKQPLTCRQSEELMMINGAAGFDQADDYRLEEHLHHCESCRNFWASVRKFCSTMQVDDQPADNILKSQIMQAWDDRHRQAQPRMMKLFSGIKKMVIRPVPLYQPALVLGIILILFFGPHLKERIAHSFSPPAPKASAHYLVMPVSIDDQFNNLQEQIGINAGEDSLFSRMFYTSM